MLLTAFGLLVALAPLLASRLFGAGARGIVSVAAYAALWHLAVALGSMALGVFSYPVVLGAHLVGAAALIVLAARRRALGLPQVRVGWFPVAAFALAAAFLVSNHFWYAGPIDTAVGYTTVGRSASSYPFYSDEWVAVALARQSIETGGLPDENPLDGGSPFVNFLAGFHALVAEVLTLLALDPLTGYAWLAIGNGLAIVVLAFLVLRRLGVGQTSAALAAASLPFLTVSGNLPGLWYLLPYTLALSGLLLALAAALSGATRASAAAFAFAALVYPPSLALAALVTLGLALDRGGFRRRAAALAVALTLLAVLVATLAAGGFGAPWETARRAADLLVRERLDPGHVAYWPWHVLPLFLVPLAALGCLGLWRRRAACLGLPLAALLAAWAAYPLLGSRVVLVEESRVVAAAAIFLAVAAGFGFDWVRRLLARAAGAALDVAATGWVKVAALGFLFAFAWAHPSLALWNRSTLRVEQLDGSAAQFTPAPPVTRYLTEDDRALFAGAHGAVFIAPPWKGLALAAATGAIPLDSKPSTLSRQRLAFEVFVDANCAGKQALAARFRIDLAYAPAFSCPSFTEVGRSGEGLVLYRVGGG